MNRIAVAPSTEGHVERRYYKASGVGGCRVDSAVLIFEDEVPEFKGDDWQRGYREMYEDDGTLLERSLFETLPGGTYDVLLRKMLERRASLLRVPL